MRWSSFALVLAVSSCSHNERAGSTAGESVPAPRAVTDNAIPRDMPPATPPIPGTSRSAGAQDPDAGWSGLLVNPPTGHGPQAPPPSPFGGVSPPR